MSIFIYNSATKTKEKFNPIAENKVGMYVCGVTIYDRLHLGHARTFIAFDAIYRWLESKYGENSVNFVRNITDIDDKIIARAKEQNVTPLELTKHFTQLMNEDFDALGLLKPTVEPKVSEHLSEIIEMIATLVKKGFAYQDESGDVLFNIEKFTDYGQLSGQQVDQIGSKFNTRDLIANKAKSNEHDFVLWKHSKEDNASYPSPFGQGRPGWHIECSAMSKKHLGSNFDIHGGGGDLKFPHHENEVAQSVSANDTAYANVWMHTGMITVDGVKMSKSLGNFITVEDLRKKYDPEVIRLFLLSSHYRSNMDFSEKTIQQTQKTLERVYRALDTSNKALTSFERTAFIDMEIANGFDSAMNDDFNTPLALSYIYEATTKLNSAVDLKDKDLLSNTIIYMSANLGLFERDPNDVLAQDTNDEIESLIQEREQARADKNWARSDEIRDILNAKGVMLNDKKI